MRTNYHDMTDAFEKLAVDPAGFRHMDHVGVAYVMLTRYDFLTATQKYAENINTIATRAGAGRKFNMTITVAFLSIISERMEATEHSDVHDFIGRNPDLITRNPLERLYSTERLRSEQARLTFLLPDLAA